MNKNVKRLGVFALAGVLGLGVASTTISAAEPSKDTDVFYTTSSTNIDADGKVVMVVPAAVSLTKENKTQEFAVTIQTADETETLPNNFKATVNVESKNEGMLKDKGMTKSFAYKLLKGEASSKEEITLANGAVKFNDFTALPDSSSVEQKATIKVEDEVVKKLENEKPGSRFTDTLTFKVTSLSGDGLTQVK
ncbi:hypothetical protein [Amedibacillus dolichus]|uniref:Uncharacterized protein n=1 Tax=Amedibacillus dolichus CAG:375 TaxID=1263076 RepID=R7GAE5_9FIRM|nr:hypothetical protein [Amedibacillus dolichus]CDE23733.1 putative uncharacterized protein [Amedibacillus dolichus CAG:375]